jgi:ligand-binding SRPBCC domain-containing protein
MFIWRTRARKTIPIGGCVSPAPWVVLQETKEIGISTKIQTVRFILTVGVSTLWKTAATGSNLLTVQYIGRSK